MVFAFDLSQYPLNEPNARWPTEWTPFNMSLMPFEGVFKTLPEKTEYFRGLLVENLNPQSPHKAIEIHLEKYPYFYHPKMGWLETSGLWDYDGRIIRCRRVSKPHQNVQLIKPQL